MVMDRNGRSHRAAGTPGAGRFESGGARPGADLPAPEPVYESEAAEWLERWGDESGDDVWPDDPGRMADRILAWSAPDLIDDPDRYNEAHAMLKAMIAPALADMDGAAPCGARDLAMGVLAD